MPTARIAARMQTLSAITLPEARPLSGAAAVPGAETALVARFVDHGATVWENTILAPEVPLRDGVVDLLRLQLRIPNGHEALWESLHLAELGDRSLFTLASFRPNQRYMMKHLKSATIHANSIIELAEAGWIEIDAGALVRPAHLVDEITSVTSYEFKTRDSRAGLRQAALRRSAVTRSYLVTTDSPPGGFPKRAEFSRLGVGWISVGRRPTHRIAATRSYSPRWARLLILRSIVRGLERGVHPHSAKRP